ncbi:hypothetical protein EDB82DRAFT_422771, partial [Fusarium venenatum]|uniref:uncharacterized protein n=1 Tax=Fusarium venenatum TaxID=56646 RepID=UPI001D32E9B9
LNPSPSTSKRKLPTEDESPKETPSKKQKKEKAEKRLCKFRTEPPKFFDRVLSRSLGQTFYILNRTSHGTEACPEEDFELVGATGNTYTVSIGNRLSCNCPHHSLGFQQCKHIIFIMKKVLNAPDELVYQQALISTELKSIFDSAPSFSVEPQEEPVKRRPIEGDCPICYCKLEEMKKASIVWCAAACGHNFHMQCLKICARPGKVTCPVCRSDWKGNKKLVTDIQKDDEQMIDRFVDAGHGVNAKLGTSDGQIKYAIRDGDERWIFLLCDLLVAIKQIFGGGLRRFRKMSKLPSTTRTLVAPKKCLPAGYTVIEEPIPTITKPNEVLVKMKAVCINTGDTKFASGQFGILVECSKFPFALGMEGSGVVIAVGSAVADFKVDDEVYGVEYEKPLFSRPPAKWCSDYVATEAKFLHKKPEHTSFEEAAALPALTVVAYQTIKNGLQLRGLDDLVGQTVYIPAALSGTGSLMIQVARNYFGAEKIISTVSTAKIGLVEEYLPGLVDQLYDYKTQNIVEMVGRGTVDFAVSTQFSTLDDCIAILKPKTGILASIASVPKSEVMLKMMGPKLFPAWLGWLLDMFQWWYTWKLRGTNIKYEFFSGNPGIMEDMEVVAGMIKQGKVKGICTVVDFENLEDIRKACDKVYKIQGGPGKLVIRM